MSGTEPDYPGRDEKALKAQLEAQAEIDELLWLMSDKRGRRFMWRLLTAAGIYQLSYVPGDAMATAFREGNKGAGLRLVALIGQHCPTRFSEMQQEARTHDRRTEHRSTRTGTSASS